MKVCFVADLSAEQLNWLSEKAKSEGITYEIFHQAEDQVEEEHNTPITEDILKGIALNTCHSLSELKGNIRNLNITSVEEALQSPEVPSTVKEVLEHYIW